MLDIFEWAYQDSDPMFFQFLFVFETGELRVRYNGTFECSAVAFGVGYTDRAEYLKTRKTHDGWKHIYP
jgi:hypothetical protein